MVSKAVAPNSELALLSDYSNIDIPIEVLTPIVTNEANSRKNIYRIHKWWARRLGTVFEALVLATLVPDNKQNDVQILRHDIKEILKDKIILDPMMGGGTSVLESLKLGCKTIGVDINPVAWFITKKEVEALDVKLLKRSFSFLQNTVGKRITSFYSTLCSNLHKSHIMYAIWFKQVKCKSCSETITLTQNYVISNKKSKRVFFCPSCFSVHETTSEEEIECLRCKRILNLKEGTVRRGIITCPKCQQSEKVLDAVKRYKSPLPMKMVCIEYFCEQCGRGYKKPDSLDLKRYQDIRKEFVHLKNKLVYPREFIPKSANDSRPSSYGYKQFYQLFNERQLLCLSLLLKEIKKINDLSTMEFILLVFSSCLETNNLLCRYETKWQKIASCFGFPAYHPVERIAENNVWGTKYGRGTFTKCYKKLLRAKVNHKEPMINKKNRTLISNTYRFTELAKSFEELISTNKDAFLVCENSESLMFLPSNSIDLVLTDPPYFDNLEYSRLADFFYVWLRKGLGNHYPAFEGPTSGRKGEIIMDGSPTKDLDSLVLSLKQVFSECHRVLKKDGLFVFTFHHTKSWAWKGLVKALIGANFKVISTQYIRSEGRTGFRKKGSISYDACVFCIKETKSGKNDNAQDEVHQHTKRWIKRLVKAGNNLKPADIYTIIMGGLLVYKPSFILSNDYLEVRNLVKRYFIEYRLEHS